MKGSTGQSRLNEVIISSTKGIIGQDGYIMPVSNYIISGG